MNRYQVCCRYCGSVVELGYFKTREEAEEFSKIPYVMFDADECETHEEEIIYPDEMWIEENNIHSQTTEVDECPLIFETEEIPF